MTRPGCTHSNWHRTSRPGQRTGRCHQWAAATSGLLLGPDRIGLPPGHLNAFTFRILDYTGQPVTSLVEQRGRPGHLIVVGRDQSGSQQPRPTMQIDGTWMVGTTLPTAGVRRAFADVAVRTAIARRAHQVLDSSPMTPKR